MVFDHHVQKPYVFLWLLSMLIIHPMDSYGFWWEKPLARMCWRWRSLNHMGCRRHEHCEAMFAQKPQNLKTHAHSYSHSHSLWWLLNLSLVECYSVEPSSWCRWVFQNLPCSRWWWLHSFGCGPFSTHSLKVILISAPSLSWQWCWLALIYWFKEPHLRLFLPVCWWQRRIYSYR